jgi:hypothetical protein
MLLDGERQRETGKVGVQIELVERIGPSIWRAISHGADLTIGDRLTFGDQSNRVCLLGTLNARVAAAEGRRVDLEFEYHDAALDEMISALTD